MVAATTRRHRPHTLHSVARSTFDEQLRAIHRTATSGGSLESSASVEESAATEGGGLPSLPADPATTSAVFPSDGGVGLVMLVLGHKMCCFF